jgi:hypothetical protein
MIAATRMTFKVVHVELALQRPALDRGGVLHAR